MEGDDPPQVPHESSQHLLRHQVFVLAVGIDPEGHSCVGFPCGAGTVHELAGGIGEAEVSAWGNNGVLGVRFEFEGAQFAQFALTFPVPDHAGSFAKVCLVGDYVDGAMVDGGHLGGEGAHIDPHNGGSQLRLHLVDNEY